MLRDVSVREVMDGEYVGVSESDDLADSAELLLAEGADVGVVMRGTEMVGSLSEADALRGLLEAASLGDPDVGFAMSDHVPTIAPDRSLPEARDRMTSLDSSWLVVTNGDAPLGIVTEHDLLAGSTIGGEGAEQATEAAGVVTPTAAGTDETTVDRDGFEDQGICEVCGALSADLAAFNGQLRCGDCREV